MCNTDESGFGLSDPPSHERKHAAGAPSHAHDEHGDERLKETLVAKLREVNIFHIASDGAGSSSRFPGLKMERNARRYVHERASPYWIVLYARLHPLCLASNALP